MQWIQTNLFWNLFLGLPNVEKRYQLNKSKSNSNLAYDQSVIKYGWCTIRVNGYAEPYDRGKFEIFNFLSPEIPNQGIFDQLAIC